MNITAGKFNKQKVLAPDKNFTRPTLSKIRMAVFNTLYSIIDFKDKSFLDLFAGSGIMGLEALSRGFNTITQIEKNPKVYNILKENSKKFNDNNQITLLLGDSLKLIKLLRTKFDVIYIDPPYSSGIYEQCLDLIKDISGDIIILEHNNNIKIPKDYILIKQKKYADKFVTFLRLNNG